MANLTTVLDIVKVMAFALQEGKVAVHCHAGLGRTGRSYLTMSVNAARILHLHISPISFKCSERLPFFSSPRCAFGMFLSLCYRNGS